MQYIIYIYFIMLYIYIFKDFIYLFLERGSKGKRKEEKHLSTCKKYIDLLPLAHPQLRTWPTTQACALTGNQTGDFSVHRPALNPLGNSSQGYIF